VALVALGNSQERRTARATRVARPHAKASDARSGALGAACLATDCLVMKEPHYLTRKRSGYGVCVKHRSSRGALWRRGPVDPARVGSRQPADTGSGRKMEPPLGSEILKDPHPPDFKDLGALGSMIIH
jgi:hypothetical protein